MTDREKMLRTPRGGTPEDGAQAPEQHDQHATPAPSGAGGQVSEPGPPAAPEAPTGPAAANGAEQGPGDGSTDLAGDLDELVAVAAKRDEYLALAQRTQADFENYRKRVAKEAAAAQARGAVSLAKELLPALDNLDRALGAAAKDDPLLEGVRLVRAELSVALARVGIESFSPMGEAFDPSMHEAVATAPGADDGGARGTVLEVYQDGYRLGEHVLRPARVVVAA
jgi:molecular chaperone GrpE